MAERIATISSWDPFNSWPKARPWIWAFLAVWIGLFQGPAFVRSLRPERDNGVDFFQEWASARNVLEGLPVYMDLKDAVERHLGLQGAKIQVEVNAHPPTSVLLVTPLGYLDYPDAVLVWNLLSLANLPLTLWLICKALRLSPRAWSVFPALTLMLLCNPLRQQVTLGQFNLILLLLCVGVWVAARTEKAWLAGVLLGLATAIKLFPGFLFLYFVLRRQWKVVGAGIATFLALTVVTAACLGIETYRGYIVEILPRNERSHSGWKNASLPGWWTKNFDPATKEEHLEPLWRSPTLARVGTVVSCLAIVILLARAILRAGSQAELSRPAEVAMPCPGGTGVPPVQKTGETPVPPAYSFPRAYLDLAFGLTMIAMLIVSPLAWDHYFVLLVLPLALMITLVPMDRLQRGLFLFLLLVLWIDAEIWYPLFIPGGRDGVATPVQVLTALSFQCYALVGLFLFGLLASRERQRPERVALAKLDSGR